MKTLQKLLTGAALLLTASASIAAPISVSSYDVTNTNLSGFGGWAHTYNGTISGSNYTGGSGTLNDSVIGTGTQDTHLFSTADNSTIDLFLADLSTISQLSLFSFGPTSNGIPGSITGVNVTINGITEYITSNGFGPANPNSNNGRNHSHELLDLVGSSLANLVTNKITLSGFTTEAPYANYYSISEVTVEGGVQVNNVPAPSAFALFGLAFAGLVARRKA